MSYSSPSPLSLNEDVLIQHIAVPERLTLPRPVYFRTCLLLKGVLINEHQHPFVEFLYAREGGMRVEIEGQALIVPGFYGIWIPANVPHRVLTTSNVLLESLYIGSDSVVLNHDNCRVVVVSNFVREFIHHATKNVPEQYDSQGDDGMLVAVLSAQIQKLPDAGFSLPWPSSPTLMRVCRDIQEHPDEEHSIERWASTIGMSVRTFSRRFKKETGVAFSEWKKRMRLLESVIMLKNNRSVTQVALDLGYSGTASFSFAFRQMFGVPPTRY